MQSKKFQIKIFNGGDFNPDATEGLIGIEVITGREISGWLCSDTADLELTLKEKNKIYSPSFAERKDISEFFKEKYKEKKGFSFNLDEEINFQQAKNLSFQCNKNLRAVSESPIFTDLKFDKDDKKDVFEYTKHFGLFDKDYYIEQTDIEHATDEETAFIHYLESGWKQGKNPHPLFSVKFYLKKYEDVKKSKINPLVHYLHAGDEESRATSPEFDLNFYRKKYISEIPGKISALHHYLKVGRFTNKSPISWIDNEAIKEIREKYPNQLPHVAYKREAHKYHLPNKALTTIGKSEPIQESKNKGLDIIIPFYKESYLISIQEKNIVQLKDELVAIGANLILVYDSPDDKEAEIAFDGLAEKCKKLVRTTVIKNTENLGFLLSCNNAMQLSLSNKNNILLLNSDCFPTKGALTELTNAVTLDPMIAFACPRSNNATLATFPNIYGDWNEQFRNYLQVKSHLPRISYVPTAVGFCLWISKKIIREFGSLDPIYGHGYNEENDLILRANRYGYRAVLANHAYAFHMGQQSFSSTEFSDEVTSPIFEKRFPEYKNSIKKYFKSQEKFYEDMISGLCKSSKGKRILLDATALGPNKNGTSELVRNILPHLLSNGKEIDWHIIASPEACSAHDLGKFDNLSLIHEWPNSDSAEQKYAIVFRLSQPFETAPILNALKSGYSYVCFMLDAIAYDCQYLYTEQNQIAWDMLFQVADGIVYQSEFTKDQFLLRFDNAKKIPSLVSYHSLKKEEYFFKEPVDETVEIDKRVKNGTQGKDFIFIVGNHFSHKDVLRTYSLIASAMMETPIVVLGHKSMNLATWHHLSTMLQSGDVDDLTIEYLYRKAKVILFPSHYEGFGFPLLNAVGNNKSIVLRKTKIAQELISNIQAENIFFYDDITQVLAATQKALKHSAKIQQKSKLSTEHSWKNSADEITNFLFDNFSQKDTDKIYKRHLILKLAQAL